MNNAPATPRSYSLQREWSRAFTLMLLTLLVGAVVTIVGVRFVVSEMEGAARHLKVDYGSVDELTGALEAHEHLGHQLLQARAVDSRALAGAQEDVEELFKAAAAIVAGNGGRSAALDQARQDWQASLERSGLWNGQPPDATWSHAADATSFIDTVPPPSDGQGPHPAAQRPSPRSPKA